MCRPKKFGTRLRSPKVFYRTKNIFLNFLFLEKGNRPATSTASLIRAGWAGTFAGSTPAYLDADRTASAGDMDSHAHAASGYQHAVSRVYPAALQRG